MSWLPKADWERATRPAADHETPGPWPQSNRCDACWSDPPPGPLIGAMVPGFTVQMCANPAACRQRAQLAGIWAVYPR